MHGTWIAHTVEPKSSRKQLALFLESWRFELTILILLMIDVFVTVAEVLYEEEILRDTHGIAHFVHTLGTVGKVITAMFLCDVLCHIYAFGKEWFKHTAYVIDGIVVTISFVLDFVVIPICYGSHGSEDEISRGELNTEIVANLIKVARLWRVIRIFHGTVMCETIRHEHHHHEVEEIKEAMHKQEEQYLLEEEDLENQMETMQQTVADLSASALKKDDEIKRLRLQVSELEASGA